MNGVGAIGVVGPAKFVRRKVLVAVKPAEYEEVLFLHVPLEIEVDKLEDEEIAFIGRHEGHQVAVEINLSTDGVEAQNARQPVLASTTIGAG